MRIEQISNIQALQGVEKKLTELAKCSIEPNPFYEAWMLIPAFEFLKDEAISLVLLWDSQGALCGAIPLQRKLHYRHLPVRHFSSWRHLHCFSSTPLLRESTERECFEALFSWLAKEDQSGLVFVFEQMPRDCVAFKVLVEFANQKKLKIDFLEEYERPIFDSTLSTEEYFAAALSSKHRKDLKKKQQALQQLGTLAFTACSAEEDLTIWITNFLELEAKGWKGQQNTAMNCHEHEKNFFHAIVTNAAKENKLFFYAMTLNQVPIAMRCGFKSGCEVYSFKIAFDEEYKKFSPGVLLEMEHMRHLQKFPEVKRVDSCAMPDHIMHTRLWMETRRIATVGVSTSRGSGNYLLGILGGLKSIKNALKFSFRPKEVISVDAGKLRPA